MTAPMIAAEMENKEIAKILIAKGADVDETEGDRKLPEEVHVCGMNPG